MRKYVRAFLNRFCPLEKAPVCEPAKSRVKRRSVAEPLKESLPREWKLGAREAGSVQCTGDRVVNGSRL